MCPKLGVNAPSAPAVFSANALPNNYHRVGMVVPIVVVRIVVVPMAMMVVMIIIRLRESGRRKEHDHG
jgi:hypothetical protein